MSMEGMLIIIIIFSFLSVQQRLCCFNNNKTRRKEPRQDVSLLFYIFYRYFFREISLKLFFRRFVWVNGHNYHDSWWSFSMINCKNYSKMFFKSSPFSKTTLHITNIHLSLIFLFFFHHHHQVFFLLLLHSSIHFHSIL